MSWITYFSMEMPCSLFYNRIYSCICPIAVTLPDLFLTSSPTFSFSPWLIWLNISFLSSWIFFFFFNLKMPLGKLSPSWLGCVFLLYGPSGTQGSSDSSIDHMAFKSPIYFSTILQIVMYAYISSIVPNIWYVIDNHYWINEWK